MDQFISELNNIPPTAIWGVLIRSLGVIYLIAIGSFYHQILPFAGKNGIVPAKIFLKKVKEDFPSFKRFFYFPSYLWINQSDFFLKGLIAIGVCSSIYVIIGGPYSPLALFICYSIYLSYDHFLFLSFPWDCLLLEAGFLAIFLPATYALPEIASVNPPHLLCALAFQLLVFRVIFGFGKFKFFGTNKKEIGYLKYFFINQPIPTVFGWLFHQFPFWAFKFLIAFMFISEMIVPFFIFIPGTLRLVAGIVICFLMIGIQLTGNFGFFNLLTIVLCFSLLDTQISYAQMSLSQLFQNPSTGIVSVIFILHFIGSLIYFPFNNWCTRTWIHWVSLMRVKNRPFQLLLKFYRALGQFRMIHGYGVFPPISAPAVRWIPLIEGSHDGKIWKEYGYHFMPCKETSPPKFIAPYHPRFDHLVFYENPGFNGSNFFVSNVGFNNPYVFSRANLFSKISQRLLNGEKQIHQLFKVNPFPDVKNPPSMLRVKNFMLEPTSIAQWKKTGHWYKRIHVGVHYPLVKKEDNPWQFSLPDPELFHWDEWIWKYRSVSVRRMLKDFKFKGNVDQAVCTLSHISLEDINVFWNEFLPLAMPENKRNFKDLKKVCENVVKVYSWQTLKKYERIFFSYSILLFDNLLPYFLNQKEPFLTVKSSFHLGMVIHDALGESKESYLKLFNNPQIVNECSKNLNKSHGFYFYGLFYYDILVYHARRLRVTQRIGEIGPTPEISGFFDMISFIVNEFEPDEDEQLPTFSRSIKDGQWIYHC